MNQSLYDLTDNALNLEALLEQVESGADAAILQVFFPRLKETQ